MHVPNLQKRVFSEGSEAPQAAQHTRTMLGDPKTDKKTAKSSKKTTKISKAHKVHAPTFQGRVFLRVLKRHLQRNTRAPCWETPKPTQIYSKFKNIWKYTKQNENWAPYAQSGKLTGLARLGFLIWPPDYPIGFRNLAA